MCDFFGWNKHNKNLKDAREDFKAALVKQFNDIYGTDADNLESWQKLCRVLHIVPVPTRLAECRQVGYIDPQFLSQILPRTDSV